MPRNSQAHRQRRKTRRGLWLKESRFPFNEKWGDKIYPRIAIFRLRRSDMTMWLTRTNPNTPPEQVEELFREAQATLPPQSPTTVRGFTEAVRRAKREAHASQ